MLSTHAGARQCRPADSWTTLLSSALKYSCKQFDKRTHKGTPQRVARQQSAGSLRGIVEAEGSRFRDTESIDPPGE